MPRYQTLEQFLQKPFGGSNMDPAKLAKYRQMYAENTSKIELHSHTKIEDSYYFHVRIPSDSRKDEGIYYDVIIRFFANDPEVQKSMSLRNYYISFFSNSPGFIYNYAVLYKQEGFLIEELYTKLDPQYFNKLPTKTNKNLTLSFDKSIYFACRFLSEKQFRVLNKLGSNLGGKPMRPGPFFSEIKDFQTIKMEGDLVALERKAKKRLEENPRDYSLHHDAANQKRSLDEHIKNPVKSTAKEKRNIFVVRKRGGTSTGVKSIVRKTATKSTKRK